MRAYTEPRAASILRLLFCIPRTCTRTYLDCRTSASPRRTVPMPVWLRNLQSQVRFNAPLLKLHCELLLNLLRGSRYDVSVVCLDTVGIRNLNSVYRNVDRATDVLAFPYHEVGRGKGAGSLSFSPLSLSLSLSLPPSLSLSPSPSPSSSPSPSLSPPPPPFQNASPGVLPPAERECDYNLGDVILGVPVIMEESDGVKLEHRLPVMVAHGYCHLLGYRHNTQAQHQLVQYRYYIYMYTVESCKYEHI